MGSRLTAHPGRVGHELAGELGVRQVAVVLFGLPPPRGQVHLVDADRRASAVPLCAAGHPRLVAPAIGRFGTDDGGGSGRHLGGEGVRIGAVGEQCPRSGADLELVESSRRDTGNEDLPHSGLVAPAHSMAPAVPAVEVADNGEPAGVGCPDGEQGALDALDGLRVGAEHGVALGQRAFGEPHEVLGRDHRREPVGIVHDARAAGVGDPEPVGEGPLAAADGTGEQAGVVEPLKGDDGLAVGGIDHLDPIRAGGEGAHHERAAVAEGVHAKEGERIAVLTADDGGDLAGFGKRRQGFFRYLGRRFRGRRGPGRLFLGGLRDGGGCRCGRRLGF